MEKFHRKGLYDANEKNGDPVSGAPIVSVNVWSPFSWCASRGTRTISASSSRFEAVKYIRRLMNALPK